jgi:hypothetical protein
MDAHKKWIQNLADVGLLQAAVHELIITHLLYIIILYYL